MKKKSERSLNKRIGLLANEDYKKTKGMVEKRQKKKRGKELYCLFDYIVDCVCVRDSYIYKYLYN
jgi:hypothetical protein